MPKRYVVRVGSADRLVFTDTDQSFDTITQAQQAILGMTHRPGRALFIFDTDERRDVWQASAFGTCVPLDGRRIVIDLSVLDADQARVWDAWRSQPSRKKKEWAVQALLEAIDRKE